jgi:hypothetical protein
LIVNKIYIYIYIYIYTANNSYGQPPLKSSGYHQISLQSAISENNQEKSLYGTVGINPWRCPSGRADNNYGQPPSRSTGYPKESLQSGTGGNSGLPSVGATRINCEKFSVSTIEKNHGKPPYSKTNYTYGRFPSPTAGNDYGQPPSSVVGLHHRLPSYDYSSTNLHSTADNNYGQPPSGKCNNQGQSSLGCSYRKYWKKYWRHPYTKSKQYIHRHCEPVRTRLESGSTKEQFHPLMNGFDQKQAQYDTTTVYQSQQQAALIRNRNRMFHQHLQKHFSNKRKEKSCRYKY